MNRTGQELFRQSLWIGRSSEELLLYEEEKAGEKMEKKRKLASEREYVRLSAMEKFAK